MSVTSTLWGSFKGLGIAICGVYAFSANCVAQITPDGTLLHNSQVRTQDNIKIIEGGTSAGKNLFHSFQQFSVPTGSTAYFNNSPEIENIISRVTGSSVSNINGLIRANGKANLFVLNPSGIVFGQGAQLNIGGSFFASTASSMNFADGTKFSANGSQTTPLLTISVPLGLQFGTTAGGITVQGSGLAVQSGKTLALVGGDVRLDGGNLRDPNGRVELGAIAGVGTVGLNLTGNNWSLSFPDIGQRADVSLTNGTKIDVTDRGGGSVAVTARNIDILGGSRISAGIGQGLTTVGSPPGDITLNATGLATINYPSQVTNVVATNAMGDAGNINIQAGKIYINNRASDPTASNSFIPAALDTGPVGQGRAGNISLSATGSITLIGQDVDSNDQVISTFSNTQGLYGGDITLKAGSISLSDAYLKAARGNGGNISLIGSDSVFIADNSFLNAGTTQGNSGKITIQSNGPVTIQRSYLGNNVGMGDQAGNASDINISGRSVSITDGTLIESRSEKDGRNSGNIRINALDQVEISGKDPFHDTNSPGADHPEEGYYYTTLTTDTLSGSRGRAGEISVHTPTLRVSDGASLRAASQDAFSGGNINVYANIAELIRGGALVTNASNRGDAGNIKLDVTDRITIDGSNPSSYSNSASGIFANTYGDPTSRGGDVTINTGRLVVQNGGQISASTLEQGTGGTLTVNARRSVTLTGAGSRLSASADSQAAGTAGNLTIKTGQLQVLDGATVTVSAPNGQAGNISVTARSIRLQNQGQLIATTGAGEKGGNITLQDFDLLLMRDRSLISAEALNNAHGGNITMNAKNGFVVAAPLENSDITANAFNGQGGKVTINASGIFGMTVRNREDLVKLLQSNDPTQLNPGKLPTSDISAISQKSPTLNGQVTINTTSIDLSRGLVILPTNLVDATQQITTSCNPHSRRRDSSFVATGRGGIPPSPTEPLMSDTVLTPWVTLPSRLAHQQRSFVAPKTTMTVNPQLTEIVEAQGWVMDTNGNVVLVADAPTVTPHGSWQTPANCNVTSSTLGQYRH